MALRSTPPITHLENIAHPDPEAHERDSVTCVMQFNFISDKMEYMTTSLDLMRIMDALENQINVHGLEETLKYLRHAHR